MNLPPALGELLPLVAGTKSVPDGENAPSCVRPSRGKYRFGPLSQRASDRPVKRTT